MQIDQNTITFVLGLAALVSIVFSVYNAFRNPQIKTDQETLTLKSEITNLKTEVKDIKETHLRALEGEIKSLRESVTNLALNVNTLSTIINERIPKASPNLTPPGL